MIDEIPGRKLQVPYDFSLLSTIWIQYTGYTVVHVCLPTVSIEVLPHLIPVVR